MRDYVFRATEKQNKFFRNREELKSKSIIFASFCMDFMQLSGILYFYLKVQSFRAPLTFALFFPIR